MKKFFVQSFGCQMNAYDAKRIATLLVTRGWEASEVADEADAIILNTCNVREKASEKVFSALGRLFKGNRTAKFAVIGCVAKAEGEVVMQRAPYVSAVLSSHQYHKLPDALEVSDRVIDIGVEDGLAKFEELVPASKSAASELLQIQEGCDMFCTYCSVPMTRGREVSRPFNSVLEEARHLAEMGAVEITLLGQNVDAYSFDGAKLSDVIRAVAAIPGIGRIRYTTSYPSRIDPELAGLYSTEPNLASLVSLPIQSGSNSVLIAMRRRYTVDGYRAIVAALRHARPEIMMSSDFIVGFPGETNANFDETMEIVREIGFIQSFSFKYSPRPGTKAASMPDQVTEDVKEKRLYNLQTLLRSNQDRFNRGCIGLEMGVLFTENALEEGFIVGRNEYMQPVIARGSADQLGLILPTRIEAGSYANLKGRII